MSDAEIKSLILIAVVVMLAFGVRTLWGRSEPKPSAKNGWRRVEPKTSGRWFDEQSVGGGD